MKKKTVFIAVFSVFSGKHLQDSNIWNISPSSFTRKRNKRIKEFYNIETSPEDRAMRPLAADMKGRTHEHEI